MLRTALYASICGLIAWTSPAHADDNDIVLARLGNLVGAGQNMNVIGDNQDFRSAISELGVVLAPRLLSSADTLGFGGFQFTADMSFTTINNDASYWRMRQSSPDPTGTMGIAHGSGTMRSTGIFMRKGMWLPLPSFEFGVGAVHLADSRIWTGQLYAKMALHEGYHGWPLPSLSFRGAASRMMGNQDVDLTVVSLDASMSKSFGISGAVNFEPYVGGNLLIIIPRSEVIDKTPQTAGDNRMNFVFRDQDDILRNRIFLGFKLQYYVFALLVEANFALPGSSIDDHGATDMSCADVGGTTTVCDSTDQAGTQETYTVSIGLDF